MSGIVYVVGLGPGAACHITPAVSEALEQATDVVGYHRYLERLPKREGQTHHASDNRVERERAARALSLAHTGRRVALVSSGDPGVFAMASALFEVLEESAPPLQEVEVQVMPGITAMLAASARVGAPLGHDFCTINLSCNLKPWSLLERRIRSALQGDFAIAFYNPRSKHRPDDLDKALDLIRAVSDAERPVVFARAVTTPEESISVVNIGTARGAMADMRTVVLVGSSLTRVISRPRGEAIVYTPRSVQR